MAKPIRKYKKVKDCLWVKIKDWSEEPQEFRRLLYFVEPLNFNKYHQKRSIAVNKLGSIFHISLKNLSGYILVHKKRICCLDFE